MGVFQFDPICPHTYYRWHNFAASDDLVRIPGFNHGGNTMRNTTFFTIILLIVSLCSWAGKSQLPGNNPDGRTHEGVPFKKPEEFNKVAGAIGSLGKGRKVERVERGQILT